MSRYSFYIDGLNVYHSLNNARFKKYKWLNYRKLAERFLGPGDTLVDIFCFTTYARWKPASFARHRAFIKALRSVGVRDMQGRFMRHKERCHVCGSRYTAREEKQTDVNIAVHLLSDAMNDEFDRAVIISGDTDLIPAIEAVHRDAPDKEIGVMFPLRRFHDTLKKTADFSVTMKERMLDECQFPGEVKVGGTIIERPESWQ